MIWDKGQEGGTGDSEEWTEAWDDKKALAVPGVGADSFPLPLPSATTPSESLYQLLSQTSPENMHRNVTQYGLDPATRYPNLNLRAVTPNQVRLLYPCPPTHLPRPTPFPMPGLPCSVAAPVGVSPTVGMLLPLG